MTDDILSLARRTVAEATREGSKETDAELVQRAIAEGKDPAAVLLGRRGGLKGGIARRDKMTPEERKASALRAARARWDKKPKI